MPHPVRAVLFDYGMVLSGPPNPAAWKRLHTALSLAADRFHRAYWQRRHDYDRGTLSGEQYWREIAAGAGLPDLTPEALQHLLDADTDLWSDLNQPMLAWALALQQHGIPTGILSNIGDAMQHGLERKHPWLARFHHRTWSHTLGLAKPDPAIYQHAARGLATPPANLLFLDDRAENIAAAQTAGMQTIHYTTWPTFLTQLTTHNLPTLRRLS